MSQKFATFCFYRSEQKDFVCSFDGASFEQVQTTDIWIRDVDKSDFLPDEVRLPVLESVLQAHLEDYKFPQFGYSIEWRDFLLKHCHYDTLPVELPLVIAAAAFPNNTNTITSQMPTPWRDSKAVVDTAG